MYQPSIHPLVRFSRYILCIGFMIAFMAYLVPVFAIYVIAVGTGLFLLGFILQLYLYRLMSKYRVKTSLGIDFLFPEIDNWLVAVDFIAMPEEPIPTEAELSEAEIQDLIREIQTRKRKRQDAANQLAIGGTKVIPYVLQLFNEEHPEPRSKAAAILRHLGPRATSAISALIDYLDDDEPAVRAQVICALARIGSKAKDALPSLLDQLKHESDDIRTCSLLAIGRIGSGLKNSKEIIKSVSALLEDPLPNVRTAAILALENLDEKHPDAIQLLINGIRDRNPILALLCTEQIGLKGEAGKDAVPNLIEALKVNHPIIQIKVSHALYGIGYDPLALLRPILTAARAGEIYVKLEALQILEDMGPNAEAAMQAYVRMLTDKNTLVRVVAVRGISFLGEKAAPLAPQLRQALEDPAKAVRFHAEQILKSLGLPLEEPPQIEEPETE